MGKKKINDSGFNDWNPDRLQDLTGKTYLVTGGNSGIGFEASKILAKANANVIVGGRNHSKVKQAMVEIDKQGSGKIDNVIIDLADLSSVRNASKDIHKKHTKIDGLINCAGVMQTPQIETVDGFELQLATNHLGHFLFSGLLLDLIEQASGRIVSVSSIVHWTGQIHFNDLMLKEAKAYDPMKAYRQSKLATLMFSLELDRKLKTSGSSVKSIACHPGFSATQLLNNGPKGITKLIGKMFMTVLAQPAYNGAIPLVLSVAGIEAIAGAYYGPQSMGEAKGKVSDATVAEQALDEKAAERLWYESEKLVGYTWFASKSKVTV